MTTKPPGYKTRDRQWHPPGLTPAYKTSVTRSPTRALISMPTSAGEEAGPVFGHDILGPMDNDLILNWAAPGEMAMGPRILVRGRVTDDNGRGVGNTLIEVWQANAGGRYRHANEGYRAPLDPNFGGYGRVMTDAEGYYEFRTVQPGPYPWPNGMMDWRPSHIHFSLFGHSFAQRLITQMYFEGDPLIWMCPIVGGIDDAEAIKSLVAALDMAETLPMDARVYRFDIVLRGRRQTFFENRWEGL
ncbi:protocatechuate 3,4-dioxygenase subunit beta [Pseudaestuariivita atlantica]|uniref:Protocatechuate 3,4-dioxygenase n=1 Tax=Pseudaestuariivita atlantica TaxID=1317121 RepID=A0A0L1JNN4_9RHOB|nr:protocatechuate 3,4-dioxygenase subunit beta [Pseudaestuariivita atlantica]KNG93375.1 protocatechuate 3,4-dioxygenase [Pseudaestuariivita atlantica]